MSTIIRKVVGNRWENYADISLEWDLRSQVEALERRLRDHRRELNTSFHWIADIGFNHRPDAAGGGPPLSLELMQMCLESNLEIYLSEYGISAEEE